MRQFLNSFTWAFLLVFSLPSFLVVASWNSLPGDSLYTIKLGLEQSLLFVASPSVEAREALQVRYTERRLSDTKRLLAEKHSVEGLPYLTYQVTSTEATLVAAPQGQARRESALKYIVTLEKASQELEQEKQTMIFTPVVGQLSNPASVGSLTELPVVAPSSSNTIFPRPRTGNMPPVKNAPTPSSQASPQTTPSVQITTNSSVPPASTAAALQITKTQQTIQQAIKDLKKITEEENGKRDEQDETKPKPTNTPKAGQKGKENK